jgi:hypothetical protein
MLIKFFFLKFGTTHYPQVANRLHHLQNRNSKFPLNFNFIFNSLIFLQNIAFSVRILRIVIVKIVKVGASCKRTTLDETVLRKFVRNTVCVKTVFAIVADILACQSTGITNRCTWYKSSTFPPNLAPTFADNMGIIPNFNPRGNHRGLSQTRQHRSEYSGPFGEDNIQWTGSQRTIPKSLRRVLWIGDKLAGGGKKACIAQNKPRFGGLDCQ